MEEYRKQAFDFLVKTQTKLKVKFWKNDLYFYNDTKPRDIYNITLTNKLGTYKFTFGQSIANPYSGPDEYSVLACLTYFEGSFEDFCGAFGYNNVSISVKNIYKKVLEEAAGLRSIFSPAEIAELEQIC